MKSKLVRVNNKGKVYDCLLFVCPGCAAGGPKDYDGLHMLPVNVTEDIGQASWDFNGNFEAPTLSPSILTKAGKVMPRCHSYLKEGVFQFLADSTHPFTGHSVRIPDLPTWAEGLT